MSAIINPAALYSRPELEELLGKAPLAHAQAAGLRAIGDRYLGAKVLEALALAHENRSCQRAARITKGGQHETPQMVAHIQDETIRRPPGSRRATDFLRALEKAG